MTQLSGAPQPRTAFVLSGGGSLGAVQVGMIQALYARGIAPDLIVAASVGAFNGAFLASRPGGVSATAAALAQVWLGLRREDVFPLGPLTGLLGATRRRDHVVGSHRRRALLHRWLEFDALERATIRLHVVATDLLTGAEVRLSTGNAVDAILASSAIPGVFAPVRRDGNLLVDGAITNNTPLSHAVDLGATRIYVLSTGFACALTDAPRGPV